MLPLGAEASTIVAWFSAFIRKLKGNLERRLRPFAKLERCFGSRDVTPKVFSRLELADGENDEMGQRRCSNRLLAGIRDPCIRVSYEGRQRAIRISLIARSSHRAQDAGPGF